MGIFFDFSQPGILQIHGTHDPVAWQIQGGAVFSDELIAESFDTRAFITHQLARQLIAGAASSPLGLSLEQIRIREQTHEGLRLQAHFTVDPCGNRIDPGTEPVALEISTPAGTFYPTARDVFPIRPGEFEQHWYLGFRIWRLTEAARRRTGIERFDIVEGTGTIVFVDRRVSLPARPYEDITVKLTIGDNEGTARSTLVEVPCDSGRWRAGR